MKPPTVPSNLPAKLKWYYTRLFPISQICRWLSYNSATLLSRREISFTLPGDIYLRWKSFGTPEELKEALNTLTPIKMDIGAIYNHAPAEKGSISGVLTPVQKEFVLDIDMTDYEDVIPTAHADATVNCDENWGYMETAVRVLDAGLREDFGFRHLLWVYSGRRGIHCWVCDARARKMSNEARVGVAEYLSIRFEGRENVGRRQAEVTVPLHPGVKRARDVCEGAFRELVAEGGLMDAEAVVADMVGMMGNVGGKHEIMERVMKMRSGVERWERMEREIGRAGKGEYGMRGLVDYIMLRYTYPRLDVNVSKEVNHLLKGPFCVHPKTGRVCVPFRAEDVGEFKPERDVPHIQGLMDEIENGDGEMMRKLKRGVDVFEQFLGDMEQHTRNAQREERMQEMDRRQMGELLADG